MKISDRQPKISDSLKISDFSDSLGVLQHPLAPPQQYAYVYRLSSCCLTSVRRLMRLTMKNDECTLLIGSNASQPTTIVQYVTSAYF